MKLLIGILIVAAFMDILHYKISNWCIILGMAAGIWLTYTAQGKQGLLLTVLQTTLVFAVFYPLYLLKGLGAGDVKLYMMLGCYLEKTQLWHCIAVSMLLAGGIAVVKLIGQPQSRDNIRYLGRYICKVCVTGIADEFEPVITKAGVVRLALPILCSVLLCQRGVVI